MRCVKCRVEMVEGEALLNNLSGIPDFIGDDFVCTVSPDGSAELVGVLKCPQCGYSYIPLKASGHAGVNN